MRLVKSKVFMMPLSASAHEVLTWNIPSVVRFFLHRGPGFFDCVLRRQNGILSCLLCYQPAWSDVSSISCLFVMMEGLGVFEISK